MEKYTTPELEVIEFEAENIIATSGFTADTDELPLIK